MALPDRIGARQRDEAAMTRKTETAPKSPPATTARTTGTTKRRRAAATTGAAAPTSRRPDAPNAESSAIKRPAGAPKAESVATRRPAAAPKAETVPKARRRTSPKPPAPAPIAHPHSVANLAEVDEIDRVPDQPFAEGVADGLDADLRQRMISERAYRLYCERGGAEGYDLDDWLQAEAEVDHLLLNPAAK
jgi:hypothetical protein